MTQNLERKVDSPVRTNDSFRAKLANILIERKIERSGGNKVDRRDPLLIINIIRRSRVK